MQSDSVSSALERRMAFSRVRERITSWSVCLQLQLALVTESLIEGLRPPSNFKSRRCYGTKFGGDCEDAITETVRKRFCDLSRYPSNNPVELLISWICQNSLM